MATIIPLHGDPHENTQMLLPWYVNGTLEPTERQLVEQHLAGCAECRAELDGERRLAGLVGALPAETPDAWESLRDRAAVRRPARPFRWPARMGWPAKAGLAIAAQIAIITLSIGVYGQFRPGLTGDFHALSADNGAASAATQANIIAIFRPDATEQSLRAALRAAGARLTGGPTAANAYMLHVEPGRVTDALAQLNARPEVLLAQPIDLMAAP